MGFFFNVTIETKTERLIIYINCICIISSLVIIYYHIMHLYNVYQPTIIYYNICMVTYCESITLNKHVKIIINYCHGVLSQGHYRYFSRMRVTQESN